MSEIEHWQSVNHDQSEQTVDVYIDLKSPHAYLAIRPSLELAKDYRVHVNFLPYTLSYVEAGLTTEVTTEMKRKPLNQASDRKARMYYAAAREYAKLQDLPFRTPYRLLDSVLAHKALLFAKKQNLEIPFILSVYTAGWGSGWRDFELESIDDLREALVDCGTDLDGFEEYLSEEGPGVKELTSCIRSAEKTGIAGVPHYVLADQSDHKGLSLFGREHLALIRTRLSERNLARSASVKPEFSHTWSGSDKK
jgi:2-hydroxychromene-2-carboxylate isomerase